MARYWIRNRGRVQGPFSEERIQGLLRRGRFNRHFHVSEDRKNWYPASEFPEFFAGQGGPEPVDDESPFQSGGSPFDDGFDDDDAPPAQVPTSERKRKGPPSRRRRPVDEEEDDEDWDEDESEDDEDEDDDDWDDDDDEFQGVIPAFIGWVERHVMVVGGVLLVALLVLCYFLFLREDFTQDIADRDALLAVQGRVTQAYETGVRADQWNTMLDATEQELSPMITRLEDQASAMDMVKQELLWLARDDIPQMMKELPKGGQEAAGRVRIRFSLIDQMIEGKTRFHDGTALMARPPAPLPPTPPEQMSPEAAGQQDGSPGQSNGNGSQPADNGTATSGSFTPAITNQNQNAP